jgi:hypothetical protein
MSRQTQDLCIFNSCLQLAPPNPLPHLQGAARLGQFPHFAGGEDFLMPPYGNTMVSDRGIWPNFP